MNHQLDVGSGKVRTIRMHGVLGRKFGFRHRMAVSSAAEAVRALGAQLEGFEAFLTQAKDRGLGFAVFYGRRNLTVDNLLDPVGDDEIRFVPMVLGAKSGWVSVIIGVVLIVVGVVFSEFLGPFSAVLINMGWAMVIGGIIQLLTPVPKGRSAKDRPDNEASYSFNGPINTQAQGNPVPVLYGELIVGSAVLSAGILAVDAYAPATGTTPDGYGGGGGDGAIRWWAENL